MTEAGHRKRRATYKPTNGKMKTATGFPDITDEVMQTLILAIPECGHVQIVKASLHVSHRVFAHLLNLCDTSLTSNGKPNVKARELRAALEDDEVLYVGDNTFWFYVLNEMVHVGVELPIVENKHITALAMAAIVREECAA